MIVELIVQIKNIWGNERINPVNTTAVLFCRLLEQKTLTRRDIELIKELGFTVRVQYEQPETL